MKKVLAMSISDKNTFHCKCYKQEVLIWPWIFWKKKFLVLEGVRNNFCQIFSTTRYQWKPFRVCLLMQFNLLLAVRTINNSLKLWIKYSNFSGHLALRNSSENIEPLKIFDRILFSKCDMRTLKNENLSLLSKHL